MPKKMSSVSIQTRRNFIIRILKNAPEGGLCATEIFERIKKEVLNGGDEKVKNLVDSDVAKRISESVAGQELRRVAQSGDSKALGSILERVLSTPDGKELMKKVEENFKQK